MIRESVPADTPTLVTLAQGTGVFKPAEIQALQEVLDDYFAYNHDEGHVAITYLQSGQPIGFAYYAPAQMAERTWYLYWIAVSRTIQAKGVGSELMAHVEDDVRSKQGRVLFIETSSLKHYDLTRKFYLKLGYDKEAQLRDYYADGDDMVVFRKRLAK